MKPPQGKEEFIEELVRNLAMKPGQEVWRNKINLAFKYSHQVQLKEILEEVKALETTFGVEESDRYQIGQNHGRQEYQKKVLDLILTKLNQE